MDFLPRSSARTGLCWCQRQKWAAQDLRPVAPGQQSPTRAPPVPRGTPARRSPLLDQGPTHPQGIPRPQGSPAEERDLGFCRPGSEPHLK